AATVAYSFMNSSRLMGWTDEADCLVCGPRRRTSAIGCRPSSNTLQAGRKKAGPRPAVLRRGSAAGPARPHFAALAMYVTTALISASLAVEPPFGGMAPLPLIALAV